MRWAVYVWHGADTFASCSVVCRAGRKCSVWCNCRSCLNTPEGEAETGEAHDDGEDEHLVEDDDDSDVDTESGEEDSDDEIDA